MSDVPLSADRRRQRSSDALLSLSRLLDAARRLGGLHALAVADPTGVLVAGSGPFRLCEELAAYAPLVLAPDPANDIVPTRLDVLARRTEVRRLSIDGVEVLLVAHGNVPHSSGIEHAIAGCERILNRRRPGS
jgi:hypothetical protein